MLAMLATVFGASLLGSLHCVGMCGPFAMLAASGDRKSTLFPTLAYSGGRLLTYSVVGFIFGSLGLALNNGTSFTRWQQSATWLAGGLMIAVGCVSLARHFGIRVKLPVLLSPMGRYLRIGFTRAKSWPPLQRAFAIGALTSLMPCGWLYTFAIAAAGTGSPLWGLAVMVVFWMGTVPIMTALMLGFERIGSPIQVRLPVLMAGLVIAIGVFTMLRRAPVAIGQDSCVVSGADRIAEQVRTVDQELLPCCRQETKADQ